MKDKLKQSKDMLIMTKIVHLFRNKNKYLINLQMKGLKKQLSYTKN